VTRSLVVVMLLGIAACSTPAPQSAPAPVAAAPAFPDGELVDLSHTYDQTTIFWPTAAPFALETVSAGMTPGGYYYAANNFSTSEHGGTHLDSPIHFAEGKATVDRIPLNRLVGPAVVIDVTAQADANPDYLITVADLEAIEKQDGPIPPNAIVLLRTGFSRRWPDASKYLGTAERGEAAVAKLHFPGLHPDAAKWIVANRPIRAIGIDTASIDYGQSTSYESHRALFASEIPAFENLTSLERLPKRGATVIALPMKIGGGSGAPLRAIAIVPLISS
jgi:kynurenine formamidase